VGGIVGFLEQERKFSQDQAKPKKPKLVKLRPFATDQPKKQQE